MLITCPECGREISDKSNQCIHCGFPISTENNTETKPAFYKLVLLSIDRKQNIVSIKTIIELTYMNLTDVKNIVDSLPQVILKGLTIEECNNVQKLFESINAVTEIQEDNESTEHNKIIDGIKIEVEDKNTLKCPKCGSTAVTTGNRGFSIWTGFLGSNKTVNRCGKCGMTWNPKR